MVVLFYAQWGAPNEASMPLFSLLGFEKEVAMEQKRKCGGEESGGLE